jgi:hypothetical protein
MQMCSAFYHILLLKSTQNCNHIFQLHFFSSLSNKPALGFFNLFYSRFFFDFLALAIWRRDGSRVSPQLSKYHYSMSRKEEKLPRQNVSDCAYRREQSEQGDASGQSMCAAKSSGVEEDNSFL